MSIAVRYHQNKEDQMEIVNSSFMKIVVNIDQFKIGSSYFSWAKRITQNVVIDQFRKTKNYKTLFQHTENEHYLDSEASLGNHDSSIEASLEAFAAEEIEQILNQLTPASKITFNLFAIEGYSYKEIAEELDIGYETVKWHIKESRKKLKSILIHNTLEIE
jgi:RNA polymerase sigma-70 factor (ECF subfamily)